MEFRRFVVKALMIKLGADTEQLALSEEMINKIRQMQCDIQVLRIADYLNTICNEIVLDSDPFTHIKIDFAKLAGCGQ